MQKFRPRTPRVEVPVGHVSHLELPLTSVNSPSGHSWHSWLEFSAFLAPNLPGGHELPALAFRKFERQYLKDTNEASKTRYARDVTYSFRRLTQLPMSRCLGLLAFKDTRTYTRVQKSNLWLCAPRQA